MDMIKSGRFLPIGLFGGDSTAGDPPGSGAISGGLRGGLVGRGGFTLAGKIFKKN